MQKEFFPGREMVSVTNGNDKQKMYHNLIQPL